MPIPYVKRRFPRRLRRKTYKKLRGRGRVRDLAYKLRRINRRINLMGPHNVNLYKNGDLQLQSNYSVLPLSDFSTLLPCFGYTTADYNNSNQAYLKSISMQFTLTSANEEDNINYSMFLVSIGKNGDTVYDSATGTLATLTQPLHYLANQSMGMLNKKYFNVMRTKFGTLGNWSTPLQQPSASGETITAQTQFYWKIKPRRTIKNPAGNWSLLNASPDPETQYYIIVLNNNSTADLESPVLSYNIVYSINIDG